MISLSFVPVCFPDTDSRKILAPTPGATCSEWRGEEQEGWYSAQAALACLVRDGQWQIRKAFDKCVVMEPDETLLAVIQPQGRTDDGKLTAVFIRHFSAPTDADDHFEETPLLLPTRTMPLPGSAGGTLTIPTYAPSAEEAQ